MSWFLIPLLIAIVLIVVAVAIYASNARRHVPNPGRQPGETVYDEGRPRNDPNTPPA